MEYYEDEVVDDDALDLSYDNMESPSGALHGVCVFYYWKILIHISLDASDVGKDDQDVDNQGYDGLF